MLVRFKVGGNWKILASLFKIIMPTFQIVISIFVSFFMTEVMNIFVAKQEERFSMNFWHQKMSNLKTFQLHAMILL